MTLHLMKDVYGEALNNQLSQCSKSDSIHKNSIYKHLFGDRAIMQSKAHL